MAFTLSSKVIKASAPIPAEHTCDGRDASPPLTWSGAPSKTVAFALICDDPDAPVGTWVHWVLYDIPKATVELKGGVAKTKTLADGSKQGGNDFRKVGYNGPCPPRGPAHRYYFKLYALDAPTGLAAGATKAEVIEAIEGHVLAQAELIGTYQRR